MDKAIIPRAIIQDKMQHAPIPSEAIEMVNKQIIKASDDGQVSTTIYLEDTGLSSLARYSLACRFSDAGYTVTKMFANGSIASLLIEIGRAHV